jgi:hypothetical protein
VVQFAAAGSKSKFTDINKIGVDSRSAIGYIENVPYE